MNEDAYVPLKWIADRLGVEPGTIRHWRYRGWINRDGDLQHVRVQRRLYNAADVMRAEADTYMSSQSRRERQSIAA